MNGVLGSWTCISQCGACCRLCPEERGEALEALSEDQRRDYLSIVGPDGWCINYDSGGRRCRIYETRPDFCRVQQLGSLFDVSDSDLEEFAVSCCRQQIRSVYGGRSRVLRRFDRALRRSTPGDD